MSVRSHRPGWLLGPVALALVLITGGCVGRGGLPIGGGPVDPASAPSSTVAAYRTCPTSPPPALAAGQKRTVTIKTPKGTIVVAVDAGLAPNATGNFVALAACGWYEGVVFSRLVPGFVIQGGDGQYGRVGPDGKLSAADAQRVGSGSPGYSIADDPPRTDYARGTVAMARGSQPNSESDQFFIVLDNAGAQSLSQTNPYGYAILGKVTSGMDVVDAIAAMPSSGGEAGVPVDPVPMTSVTVGP